MIRLLRRLSVCAVVSALFLAPAAPGHADERRDRQWHLGFLKIAQAHQYSQGAGVRVAVLDTGVDATHPDLSGNVLPGTDFQTGGGDGRLDQHGHGTGMAGLIAAHGRGGNGVLGIAPQAKILPARISNGFDATFLPPSIEWATKQKASVISISTGFTTDSSRLRSVVDAAIAADIVIVAGVGNTPGDTSVRYPAAYAGVVAAAGVDRNGNHAAVSVIGNAAVLAAPAVDIYSCSYGGAYRIGTGTSDSTAIVAGVAALIRAKYPQLSATEVIRRMTATAIDKGAPGRDGEYGYGIVDPVAALTAEVPPAPGASGSVQPGRGGGPGAFTPPSGADGSRTGVLIMVIGAGVLLIALAVGVLVVVTRRRST